MSKIKVDQIESSNTNVKLAPKGTGLVKVQGANNDDGTLKLSAGTHGVKIKSPAHSAGQSYTLSLPDNNIEAGKFLKIASVSNDVGQLQYATIDAVDLTNLGANNITSGALDSARFGNPIQAEGSALKLVYAQPVGSTDVATITISNFEVGHYILIGKNVTFSSGSTYLKVKPMDSTGTTNFAVEYQNYSGSGTEPTANSSNVGSSGIQIKTTTSTQSYQNKLGLIAEINNASTYGSMFIKAINPQNNVNLFNGNAVQRTNGRRIHSLELLPSSGNFTQPTEFLLYKFGEV